MANTTFTVPKLTANGAWLDYRNQYVGGTTWRRDRSLSNIRFAVNHHSVTNPTYNAKADVDRIYDIHVNGNKWGGIAYQFVITSEEVTGKDGLRYAKVAYTGDLGTVRAHTPNAKGAYGIPKDYGNDYLVAACMIGQLHINNPTEAQIRSAYWLYRELIQFEAHRMPNLAGTLSDKLKSHKDFDPTACSGDWNWQRNAILNYQDPPKIEVKEEIRVATIIFGERTENDPELPKGETRVVDGKDGERRIVWSVTYTNGVETSRKVKSETIISQPIDKVTYIGTYEPPVEPEQPEQPVEPEEPVTPPELPNLPPIPTWLDKIIKSFINFIRQLFKRSK